MRGGAPLIWAEGEGLYDGLILGGYMTIETETRAEAEALAAQAPSAGRGGAAVLRAHFPAPPMGE